MRTLFAEGGVSPCYGNTVCGGWGQSLLWERCLRRVGSVLAMGTWFAEGGVSPCYGNTVCGGWGQTLLWERCLRRVGLVLALGTLSAEDGVGGEEGRGQSLLWERCLWRVGSVLAMGTWFAEGGVSHCYGNVVCNTLKCPCHEIHAASSQKIVDLSECNAMSSTY